MQVPESEAQIPRRCDHLFFDSPDGEFSLARLVIESIIAWPSESGVCNPAYLERVQQAMALRDTGITVSCFIEEFDSGGGMSGIQVVGKPDDLSMEAAQATLTSEEIMLEVNGRRGPWFFDLHFVPANSESSGD